MRWILPLGVFGREPRGTNPTSEGPTPVRCVAVAVGVVVVGAVAVAIHAVVVDLGRARANGGVVVCTQDWHPESTPHFAKDGGLWPVHCVADTWGAAFHPDLVVLHFIGNDFQSPHFAQSVRGWAAAGAARSRAATGMRRRRRPIGGPSVPTPVRSITLPNSLLTLALERNLGVAREPNRPDEVDVRADEERRLVELLSVSGHSRREDGDRNCGLFQRFRHCCRNLSDCPGRSTALVILR